MSRWKKAAEFIRRKSKKIKTWQMVVVLLVLLIMSIVFLRINNMGMVDLRDQVIAADESGDTESLEQALKELQKYVSRHMNTDTGLVALQNSYDTAVRKAFNEANNIDSSGYSAASEACQAVLYTSGYQGYAACVAAYVGVSESSLTTPKLPNPALFYASFASPIISFDLAGIAVIFTILVFLAILFKLLTEVIVYILLNSKR